MALVGRKYTQTNSGYRYGFNGKENDNEVKGEGNQIAFEERIYEPRLGRFLSVDPLANNYPFQSSFVFAANNPIVFIDVLGMGPGDPKSHKVAKGDNLTKIGKKYGVSIDDLVKMNKIKNKNKISIGQNLIVNPEEDFSRNPRGKYINPDNSDGVELEVTNIARVGIDFVTGKAEENSIIIGGGALKSVQNWEEVKNLISEGVTDIKKDGKNKPGEAYEYQFRAGTLPVNITKGVVEFFDKLTSGENPWKNNSQNTPIHVLGSFNLSIRVNANGTTATVCIYDSKTIKSFSDGKAGKEANRSRKDYFITPLTNTYQRYLWNIKL